jgi:CBS-domain-containing membrane protein
MLIMLFVAFFSWWYGTGWRQVMASFGPRLTGVAEIFSVGQLLRTLFAPWRRIITYPGASLADKWHAWGDNMVSRVIGFVVRIFVIFAALVTIAAIAVLTAIEIVVWPLLPLAIPGCLIAGLAL